MCLQTITDNRPISQGFGWKVFRKNPISGGPLRGATMSKYDYEYDKWYKSENPGYKLKTELYDKVYPAGFHVVLSRNEARRFIKSYYAERGTVVRKVEYRGAHTAGQGAPYFPGKQVIADEIRILPAKFGR